MHWHRPLMLSAIACVVAITAVAQEKDEKKKWDISESFGPTHTISFETSAGTWGMLAQGGMTPLEAIKVATLNGAKYLGLDGELGSIEKGKLADLVVLARNPLDDIRNTESVELVMVNGRLYDAATLNQIGNHPGERPKLFWERWRQGVVR